MQRRIIVPVVVLSLLAAAAFAAYLGIPHTRLSQNPDDVDHVALYQNGLAAISLVRPFEAVGGLQVLELSLPTTTIFDSVTVTGEGVTVKELRSSLAADPALHPGDKLSVRSDDGATFAGTFLGTHGDQLLLSKEGGTVVIQMQHITAVEVTGRAVDPSGPGSTAVTILVQAEKGPRSVRVAYLAQGVGWSPNYILDPKTGAMTFFATLTGLQDWHNVTLDLVAGNPNMVYTPQPMSQEPTLAYAGLTADAATKGGYGGGFGSSQALGAMHRYHYPGTVELALGETVRLPVVSGTVDVMRHYFRADGSGYAQDWAALPETYQIRNTLGETLPAGPVRVYLEGEWIGADNLPALGKGEQGNVTVSFSDDVKARTTQVSQTRSEPSFPYPASPRQGRVVVTTTYDFQVRNLSDKQVDLRATFQTNEGGTTRVLNLSPQPDEDNGSLRVWNDDVAAGATVHYTVTIETIEESYFP